MPKDRKAPSGKSKSGSAAKPRPASKSETRSTGKTVAAKKSAARSTPAKKTSPAKKAAPAKPAAKKKSAAPSSEAAKKSLSAPRKRVEKIKIEPVEIPVRTTGFVDPIGDVSDGEAHRSLAAEPAPEESVEMVEAFRADTIADAENGLPELEAELSESEADEGEESDIPAEPRPEPHLERLQKILSQAGIASRRHAEEMITEGRVMVNGQVVTQLGAKADPDRDHIRVDDKLIQRAERHRTFILNKPRGYVTTVSDPEGRSTVMDFFSKSRERLYPVGRLDYQSEGLLLMTNDGELANLLTRASSGVEKTYLVKVAGQLSEDELGRIREGVSIEKGEQGSKRVRTAPAEVRQIRPGENPWYEVILIEGRNREIRKMFSSTGHFVEKIRRVGYGPLVLDVEPGQFRELTPEELNSLRLTAEGKLKPRRPKSSAMLPKEAGLSAETRASFRGKRREGFRPGGAGREPREGKPFGHSGDRKGGPGGRFEKRPFNPNREDRGPGRPDRPSFNRPRPERPGLARPGFDRPKFDRPHGERPPFDRPRAERPAFDRPREERSGEKRFGSRPQRFGDRPGGQPDRPKFGERRPFGGDRPRFNRESRFGSGKPAERGPREFSNRRERSEERPPRREFRPREEGVERSERPKSFGGPRFDRPQGARPEGRGEGARPRFGSSGRPGGGGRPSGPGGPRRSGGFNKPGGFNRQGGPGRGGPGGRSSGPRQGGFRGRPGGGPRDRDRS
jgi:23S rRNA pseudouridine2605 synthase